MIRRRPAWPALAACALAGGALLAAAPPAAAREERMIARFAYGNGPDEISVRRAGSAPVAFLPSGVGSFALHGRAIWIPDGLKFAIRVVDEDGLSAREMPFDPKARAAGAILYGDLHVSSDEVILTDTARGMIHLLDPSLALRRSVETLSIDERFRAPGLVARDDAGRIYVTDVNTARLYVFPDSRLTAPVVLEDLPDPYVTPEGIIVVARREAGDRAAPVCLVDRFGRYLGTLGRLESETPMGPVACAGRDRDGNLHFTWAERGRRRHHVLSPTGRVAETGDYPEGISALLLARRARVTASGDLYLLSAESSGLVVRRFARPR